jgi:DNA-binding response OmpR family regulator
MGHERIRVLVVEDEWLIADCLADTLTEMGFAVMGPAYNSASALALLHQECPDFAILDVSLGSQKSFIVAEALAAKGIAFVFLTGHLLTDLPSAFANSPILAKPVREAELGALMAKLRIERRMIG